MVRPLASVSAVVRGGLAESIILHPSFLGPVRNRGKTGTGGSLPTARPGTAASGPLHDPGPRLPAKFWTGPEPWVPFLHLVRLSRALYSGHSVPNRDRGAGT